MAHIAGGTVGVLAGTAALAFPKGSPLLATPPFASLALMVFWLWR